MRGDKKLDKRFINKRFGGVFAGRYKLSKIYPRRCLEMRAKICNFVGLKGYFEMDELREIIYRERKDLESFFRENQL